MKKQSIVIKADERGMCESYVDCEQSFLCVQTVKLGGTAIKAAPDDMRVPTAATIVDMMLTEAKLDIPEVLTMIIDLNKPGGI